MEATRDTQKLTVSEAARLVGKSPSTIHRATESGKVSSQKDVHGVKRIDPAELFRVYPQKTEAQKLNDGQHKSAKDSVEGATQQNEIIAQLKERIAEKDKQIERLERKLETAERDYKELNKDYNLRLSDQNSTKKGILARVLGL